MENRVSSQERNQDARRKIMLGGLIVKMGLDEETSSVILGILDEARERLLEDDSLRTYWHMRGARIFENDDIVTAGVYRREKVSRLWSGQQQRRRQSPKLQRFELIPHRAAAPYAFDAGHDMQKYVCKL